jgi:hypothetical protein
MTKMIATSMLFAALMVGAATDANAWTRSGTFTGPRGTSTVNVTGGCANGTCSRQVTRTGPYGYSYTRQGSASCANGVCTGSRVTTGPYGNSVYRQGYVVR